MDGKLNILIAEDDEGLKILILKKLKSLGYNIKAVSSGKELLDLLKTCKADLLLLDYKLPDYTANELIRSIHTVKPDISFIIMTGHGDEKIAVEMMKMGAVDYIIKDIKFLDFLPETIRKACNEILIKLKLQSTEEALTRSEANYKLLAQNIADVIWMVDLNSRFKFVSPSVEKLLQYHPGELLGQLLERILAPESIPEAKSIFEGFVDKLEKGSDIQEQMTHFEFKGLRKDKSTVWTDTTVNVMRNADEEIVGLVGSTRNIQARKEAEEKLQESVDSLYAALEACIEAMGKTTEIRDPYTAGHQKKVARLAYKIACEMGLDETSRNCILLTGGVHDIGKISIPAEILSKPGKINTNEFEIIKTHPSVGFEILKTIDFPWPIAEIVHQHHERLDGSGYPGGLKDGEIILGARIIGVADVVEAISSYRPYRAALGVDRAVEEITMFKGILYDKDVVEACLRVIKKDRDFLES